MFFLAEAVNSSIGSSLPVFQATGKPTMPVYRSTETLWTQPLHLSNAANSYSSAFLLYYCRMGM